MTQPIGSERKPRRKWLFGGILFILLAAVLIGLVASGDLGRVFYGNNPTSMLFRLAGLEDPRSVAELARRVENGTLSDAELDRLISQALAEYPRSWGDLQVEWATLLHWLNANDRLTPKQRETWYSQLIQLTLSSRPVVRVGDPLPIDVFAREHTCAEFRVIAQAGPAELRIGEAWRRTLELDSIPQYNNQAFLLLKRAFLETEELSAGNYMLTCTLPVEVYAAAGDPQSDAPIWSGDLKATRALEVTRPDGPDAIKLVDRPGLAERIKQNIAFGHAELTKGRPGNPDELMLTVRFKGEFPIGVAFEGIALADGVEHRLSGFEYPKGLPGGTSGWFVAGQVEDFDADEVVPILRTSRDVAAASTTALEIWNGELRFDPVPVVVQAAPEPRLEGPPAPVR